MHIDIYFLRYIYIHFYQTVFIKLHVYKCIYITCTNLVTRTLGSRAPPGTSTCPSSAPPSRTSDCHENYIYTYKTVYIYVCINIIHICINMYKNMCMYIYTYIYMCMYDIVR